MCYHLIIRIFIGNWLVNHILKLLIGLFASLIGALIAEKLRIPLPWTLGPLLVIAALRLCSIPVNSSTLLRNTGQWIIGLSLGLYFTSKVVAVISSHWFAMLAGLIFALLLGLYGTFLLSRFGKVDIKTAWFSSAIGGANEMAVLAERFGVRADLVASAHTIRVVLVVLVIPFACDVLNVRGIDVSLLEQQNFELTGLIQIAILSAIGGTVAHYFGISNAWVLGPMFVVMGFTMADVHFSTIPVEFSKAAQLFIGWSLGDKFRPGFFKKSPKFLSSVVVFTFTSMLLALGFALLLASTTDIALSTLAVSVAPGGIAEMAITAKVLQLGVPFVAAFQVSRMVGVVLLTGPIYVYGIEKFCSKFKK